MGDDRAPFPAGRKVRHNIEILDSLIHLGSSHFVVCSWFLCLVLGTAIEHFQTLLVHHYADVTDVILYSTGGLLGIAFTARFLRRSDHCQ